MAPAEKMMNDGLGYLGMLIRSLERAGNFLGADNIPLQWFSREWCPPGSLYEIAGESNMARLIKHAAGEGVVSVSEAPESVPPHFELELIRLNRGHPWVKSALGEAPPVGWTFQPVKIKGEPLSETILRDRR